jgi:tetratricopeptide (TPR) repeat protein
MQYYNQGDYTKALEILKQIPAPSRNPQVIFFKGVCFLLVDELKNAVTELDIIIENMNASYYDEAIYYKAIALLRMNKKDKALEQLKHLAGMFSPYAPKARELIEKVNNTL